MIRSKGAIGLLVLALLVGFAGCIGFNARGNLVEQEEVVKQKWAEVENQYQRRADLVPNLVATVRQAEHYEQGLLESVLEAQSQASGSRLSLSDLNDPAKLRQYGQAQSQLKGAIDRLLQDSGAIEAYRDLQAQLEGAENRITVARMRYNEAVSEFNMMTRTFPGMLVPGFSPKTPFEAEAGASEAPDVSFK
jgi:LemA protein